MVGRDQIYHKDLRASLDLITPDRTNLSGKEQVNVTFDFVSTQTVFLLKIQIM